MRILPAGRSPDGAWRRSRLIAVIEPRKLLAIIRGELDWIVMKAMEKDRTRRYETANALADDIKHHLANEPVAASPPSTRYLLSKFVRRNRKGVIAAAVIAGALVLGTIGTTVGMLWAINEKVPCHARRRYRGARGLQSRAPERCSCHRGPAHGRRRRIAGRHRAAPSGLGVPAPRESPRPLAAIAVSCGLADP